MGGVLIFLIQALLEHAVHFAFSARAVNTGAFRSFHDTNVSEIPESLI